MFVFVSLCAVCRVQVLPRLYCDVPSAHHDCALAQDEKALWTGCVEWWAGSLGIVGYVAVASISGSAPSQR